MGSDCMMNPPCHLQIQFLLGAVLVRRAQRSPKLVWGQPICCLDAKFIHSHGACRIWFSCINPIFRTVYGLIMIQVGNLRCMLATRDQLPLYDAVLGIFGYQ